MESDEKQGAQQLEVRSSYEFMTIPYNHQRLLKIPSLLIYLPFSVCPLRARGALIDLRPFHHDRPQRFCSTFKGLGDTDNIVR